MPLPRSKRPRSGWSGTGRWLPLALLAACAAPVDRPEVAPAPQVRGDAFLVAPTTGYPVTLGPADAEALEEGYQDLMRGESPAAILVTAESLRQGTAAFAATVLAAQARYVQGQCGLAVGQLAAEVERQASYLAADLILGRCREEIGDLPGAAAAYQRAAGDSSAAAARWHEVAPQARDAAVARIEGWIAGGLTDEASVAIESLQQWAPRDTKTLAAIRRLAEGTGDRPLELRTARALVAATDGVVPGSGQEAPGRELLVRLAELELEVGDAGAGLRILEELVAGDPADRTLAQELDKARFAWRMSMLPGPARRLAAEPELDRGQLATLLYWVFPNVRYGRPSEAVIANDVLDHEHRAEIVRVVNLGIMDIDSNLHAFEPYETAERFDALRGLLRVLGLQAGGDRCLAGTTVDSRTSFATTCSLAARCGLLAEADDCLPQAVLSGSSAMAMARSAARRLESR